MKLACRVATTTLPSYVISGSQKTKTLNATINGRLILDGISVNVNDRILFLGNNINLTNNITNNMTNNINNTNDESFSSFNYNYQNDQSTKANNINSIISDADESRYDIEASKSNINGVSSDDNKSITNFGGVKDDNISVVEKGPLNSEEKTVELVKFTEAESTKFKFWLSRPSESLIRFFVFQIVEVLFLRNLKYVHGDLKPKNILINETLIIKLSGCRFTEGLHENKIRIINYENKSLDLAPEYYRSEK